MTLTNMAFNSAVFKTRALTAIIFAAVMLAGLIIPPAVVPTIFLLQEIGLYKTLIGLILIEVALQLSFATLIFRTFMASIPKEIDED